MERKNACYGLTCAGLLLAGCLGGELDTPPQRDTRTVVDPPPGPGPARQLYPALKTGERWAYLQWNGNDTGATALLEVVGDSAVGSDSVYVETLSLKVPTFISGDGTIIQNYKQTGRLYLRKSDQEPVHDTIVTSMELWFPGEDTATHYREEEWSVTSFTGALPDSLVDGAAWKLDGSRHQRIHWFYRGQSGTEDSVYTRTRSYLAKASPALSVKAGTFPVIQIDWSDAGSSGGASGWYAPAAKAMIREIDSNGITSDTTELTSYLLK